MTCRSKHVHTINVVFSSFFHSIYISCIFWVWEWIHPFVQDSFGQKRETYTGHDSYTRRAYLKYVINPVIMWLDQSDRGVNILTPAHGNTAKVTRLFSESGAHGGARLSEDKPVWMIGVTDPNTEYCTCIEILKYSLSNLLNKLLPLKPYWRVPPPPPPPHLFKVLTPLILILWVPFYLHQPPNYNKL